MREPAANFRVRPDAEDVDGQDTDSMDHSRPETSAPDASPGAETGSTSDFLLAERAAIIKTATIRLGGMHARVALAHGTLMIDSTTGEGTTVRISIPFRRSDARAAEAAVAPE